MEADVDADAPASLPDPLGRPVADATGWSAPPSCCARPSGR